MALKAIDSERITFAGTAIGFTASKAYPEASKVKMALVKLDPTSGQIRVQTAAGVTVTAGGAEGSPTQDAGDEFEVWGYDDLVNFRGIRTGGTSGTGQVIYQGEGTT